MWLGTTEKNSEVGNINPKFCDLFFLKFKLHMGSKQLKRIITSGMMENPINWDNKTN